MPNLTLTDGGLRERLNAFDADVLPPEVRARALDRFFALRSGRQGPGRYWRIDLETIGPDASAVAVPVGSNAVSPRSQTFVTPAATMTIENPSGRALACDLVTAACLHRPLLMRALGATTAAETKFGALTTAFAQLGAFVYVPADVAAEEPITITYDVPRGAAVFPYTVVLAERGARATVIERFTGDGTFVCGIDEVAAEDGSDVSFVTCQRLCADTQFVQTRAARPQRDATVAWACAELGSALCVVDLSIAIEAPGISANVTSLFFPSGTQHVDVVSTVDHAIGDSTSQTLVKSAAVDRGQARFLGNIRIAPNAQRSNANLRDDALLLSPNAHVDSVPALEIGANDVKAYHGATVGAIDAEQIFYMGSRGIERRAAERMIALGFFEPAIAHFPTEQLREEIRRALEGKLG